MKKLRRTSNIWFMLLLGFCILMGSGISASAANTVAPSRVHITAAYNGYNNYYETPIAFDLKSKGDRIANLKSSSSNLLTWQTYKDVKSEDGYFHSHVGIGIYAKKSGTYTVTFNILNKNGKKKSTEKVTVYADKNQPIKSVTFSGKKINSVLFTASLTSGRVKVTMNKGYKLKKIEVGTWKTVATQNGTESKLVYKTIQNNAVLKLGKKCFQSDTIEGNLKKGYYHEYYANDMWAAHVIRVTYVDKYTGKTMTNTEHDICLLVE